MPDDTEHDAASVIIAGVIGMFCEWIIGHDEHEVEEYIDAAIAELEKL